MAGMDPLAFFRKHKRIVIFVTVVTVVCYAGYKMHDLRGSILLAGAIILFAICFYPSKDDRKSNPPKSKPRQKERNPLYYR
jgi:hypothetical protein